MKEVSHMAYCPVCGSLVHERSAPSAVYNNATYFFACDGCRRHGERFSVTVSPPVQHAVRRKTP